MADETVQMLIDILMDNVDRKADDQQERLENFSEKEKSTVVMGKDVVHHDDRKLKPSVRRAKKLMYESRLDEVLRNLVENWDERRSMNSSRKMVLKDLRDVFASNPLMEGVKGASMLDKKYRSRGGGEVDL